MKLSKLSIPYKAAQKLFAIIVFFLFTSSASLASESLIIILGALGVMVLVILIAAGYEYLYWKNFEYSVESDGLKIVSGVITKNDRDIPLKRIQNVDVNRNIAQRALGIAKVDVETAGGGKTEASLKYLDYEDAKQMQQRVRELKNRRKQDRASEEATGEEREDFVLSNRNLTILSLASVDMRVVGGIGVLFSIFGGTIASQFEGSLPQTLGFAAVAVLGLIIIGGIWLSGAVSTFIKYYDFKLFFHENALEYERGLLNRASGTIPEEKIQDIIIEENFIQRYLGFATLKVETAGYTGAQQGEIDTGSETVIPLAKRQEIEKFAKEIGGYTEPSFELIGSKAKSRYFRRYLLAGILLVGVPLAVSQFVSISPIVYLPGSLLVLSSKKAADLKWQNIGYHLDRKHLFTRKGFWNRKTYVIPYFRVQNLMLTQTVFQRRWDQSTLVVDTAGSVMSYPHVPDMDEAKAEAFRDQLFESFNQSLRQQ